MMPQNQAVRFDSADQQTNLSSQIVQTVRELSSFLELQHRDRWEKLNWIMKDQKVS
jgi:hypothetical protein